MFYVFKNLHIKLNNCYLLNLCTLDEQLLLKASEFIKIIVNNTFIVGFDY